MAYDEEAFILIVVIAIFFACYKVCCIFFCSDESDEESAGRPVYKYYLFKFYQNISTLLDFAALIGI